MTDEPISKPDKLLWPAVGVTKADLADYYRRVADRLLPELEGRPVTLNHHPAGVEAPGFLRKDLAGHAPPSIGRYTTFAPSAGRNVTYGLIEDVDGLLWCAQNNVTELHVGLFRVDLPDRGDRLVLDLDPTPGSVPVTTAAGWVRDVLTASKLRSRVKTTGGRGLHIIVPIQRRYRPERLVHVTKLLAQRCVAAHPEALTAEMRKGKREGRLLVDWSRGPTGDTIIAAWSPRARPTATVATPLAWDRVDDTLDVEAYTMATAIDRDDPWSEDGLAPQLIGHI